ncbi:hypothetical protein XFF6992_230054 [Xanthomonas citri pv. fuscans]|nr:hypothetical protein XFF7767_140045 [Xanthomonas citri pv. fuscans]SOO08638.1 hypothetical protein XFF6970_250045 [Xanthomonas citri pv. fuscans]SOO18358.1 hypothetical protein XFF6992_230054 [Xanthomonas citri pv. fuscans]SOO32271.1 hypothetical protein XFF6994_1820002 [Xanthomonas citri pv. fuscans]
MPRIGIYHLHTPIPARRPARLPPALRLLAALSFEDGRRAGYEMRAACVRCTALHQASTAQCSHPLR